MTATWTILTPRAAPGAIGIVALAAASTAELDALLTRLGLGNLPSGAVRVLDLLGIDRGVAARWNTTVCHLMPHAGLGVIRSLTSRLRELGVPESSSSRPTDLYPEARDPLEARMLATLARAASPLAIDLLLDQPRRWATGAESDAAFDAFRSCLLDPPLVVALGAANVGKSTLVNALAGRSVSIVADEPGTTRDHVGVFLNLAGLVIRYLDTPGLRASTDPIEREAQDVAARTALLADLILLIGDAASPPPEVHASTIPSLRVALRSDLGTASWPHDCAVCAPRGLGVPELVSSIVERLVPSAAITDPGPWRFWKNPAGP